MRLTDEPPRLPDPEALGFAGTEEHGWTRTIRQRQMHFRLLRTLNDLAHAERLQEDVLGVGERDLIPASELIVVPETGGAVIGAFLPADPERAAGVVVGWGGFVARPRVVSDFLAVRREARNLGLAAELKRLQAAIALGRRFEEIVWTVDPLRAANARLNFGKLGAVSRGYEIDRYGTGFAPGLYGGMPSDRIHVTWEITTPRVIARLLDDHPPHPATIGDAAPFSPGMAADLARLALPAHIDALLTSDPAAALSWRLRLRDALTAAFDEGFSIVGFLPAISDGDPDYLLRRTQESPD
jgi:predicted GNAT superfamily acetyltransferase